jgi:adenine-specific DNA-methyltransferase
MNARYKNPDNDPRGAWQSGDLVANEARKNGSYKVYSPKTGKVFEIPEYKHWVYAEDTMQSMIKDNRIWFGADGNSFPRKKRFLNEVTTGKVADTIWSSKEVGHNQSAKREIVTIFDRENEPFASPKPTTLINRILQIATTPNSIILDSFAGSGTTAHAVLDLNKQDGGNRKFILVEMEGYANDITAERVRRVIKGVPTAKDKTLQEGLGGSFTYAELGDAFEIEKILTGENLPSYGALASYVFYTATGQSLPAEITTPAPDYYVGESTTHEVYLVYQPDLAFLRSNESALNQDRLDAIIKRKSTKPKLVFATAKYMGQNTLSDHNISFCQLPYAIHKVMGA